MAAAWPISQSSTSSIQRPSGMSSGPPPNVWPSSPWSAKCKYCKARRPGGQARQAGGPSTWRPAWPLGQLGYSSTSGPGRNARKNTPATRSSSSWTHRARRTSSPSTRAPGFLTLQARATSPCRPTLVRLEMAQHQPRTPGSDARLSHFLSAGHVQATLRQRV